MLTMIKKLTDEATASAALKWVLSLGVLSALVVICAALIYLVRESNQDTSATANNVLVAWTKCAQELPAIAAQIRDDSRINAEYMRLKTDAAHAERLEIKAELTELRRAITELVQALRDTEASRKNDRQTPVVPGSGSSG